MLLLPAAMAIVLDSRLGPGPCALDSSFANAVSDRLRDHRTTIRALYEWPTIWPERAPVAHFWVTSGLNAQHFMRSGCGSGNVPSRSFESREI